MPLAYTRQVLLGAHRNDLTLVPVLTCVHCALWLTKVCMIPPEQPGSPNIVTQWLPTPASTCGMSWVPTEDTSYGGTSRHTYSD